MNTFLNKRAFFDVGQTIFVGFTTSSFCRFLIERNLIDKSIKKEYDLLEKSYSEKKFTYRQVCTLALSIFAKAVRGMSVNQVREWGSQFLNQKEYFFSWVRPVFKFLQGKRFETYLISAGPSPIIEAIGSILEATQTFSTTLEIMDGIYTGELVLMLHYEEKEKLLHALLENSSETSLNIGFGDSTGDIEMLSQMQKVFITNPHQENVIELAKRNKWLITQEADQIIAEINLLDGE